MSRLAIEGGTPVRDGPFPEYRTIGAEEKAAVAEVLDSGVLSAFLGTWSPEFLGGPRVRRLEERTAVGYDMGTAILTHVALR